MNIFMDSRERPITMSLRPATELFSEWADAGRDEGMERGHTPVSYTHLTLPTTPYV